MSKQHRTTRRTFIASVGYAGAVLPLVSPRLVRAVSPSSKLNLASVGCAGKGWEDLISASGQGKLHNVVALCDIDHRKSGDQPGNLHPAQAKRPLGIGAAAEKFPDAARYADFRKLLDNAKDIDAVTVSTPDHMHATIALTAMSLGKHVYCQKPLVQTVHEARVMRKVAAEKKLTTQMGNQFHTSIGYRCLVKVIQSGAIGKVREAHAWTGSPSWPQGIDRPAGSDPIPEGVHWDLWLGVAHPRPYKKHVYHNFNWRGWKEFGTGALGDMGCHVMDPVTWALDLGQPTTIHADTDEPFAETYPKWSQVHYEFAPTPYTATEGLKLTWYDAGRKPPIELARTPKGYKLPGTGSMFIGEKGVLITSHAPTAPRLYPQEKFQDYSRTTLRDTFKSFAPEDHYRNWTDAIIAGKLAASNFDVAAPLAETVLLGTIAQRLPGQKLSYNSESMRFDGNAKADALLRREYRAGWQIPELS
ncbi:Gfo/Idh/MocA family oxidoreductase [Planctomycetales bacterium ZRK34]|nr:Gfo/Idh/MocA family oxidoreductase [Planctomycetales bacterium ZRK34]